MSTPPSTLEHLSAARLLPRPSSLQRWRPLRDCPLSIFCAAASKSDAFKKKARAASVHMAAFCMLSLHSGQSLPHASARVGGQPPLPNKTVSPNSRRHISLHPGRPDAPPNCRGRTERGGSHAAATPLAVRGGRARTDPLSLISTVVLSPRRRRTRAR